MPVPEPLPAPPTARTAGLAAVANPRRQALLRELWAGTRTAGELARACPDVSFGAVSQHLRVLERAGLVVVTREGRHRRYRVERTALGPLAAALDAMWADQLDALKHLAESEAAGVDVTEATQQDREPTREGA